MHGDAKFAVDGWAEDFESGWKYQLQINSDNVLLDNDVYKAITRSEQKLWSAFSPSGMAAINYSQSQIPPANAKNNLVVHLLDVNGKYADFGYPMKNMKGTLLFDANGIAFSDVMSQWEGRSITINGRVSFSQLGQPIYDIVINGENIPLDSTLEESLPPAQRGFYNQFETAGKIDATIRVSSGQNQSKADAFLAEVFPKGSSLKLKTLPITVSDITGKIVFDPNVADIENLTGRYASGTISLAGRVWAGQEPSEASYCLSLRPRRLNWAKNH